MAPRSAPYDGPDVTCVCGELLGPQRPYNLLRVRGIKRAAWDAWGCPVCRRIYLRVAGPVISLGPVRPTRKDPVSGLVR